MKKTQMILMMVFLLTGCPEDNDDSCSTENSYIYESTDRYGLTLYPSENMYVSFEQITTFYEQTMTCMGMTADGPDVYFKSFSANYIGGAWAFYHASGVIWINTDENDSNHQRSCETDRQALQHEFIHHILTSNGMLEESRAHASPLFSRCGVGVNVDL